MLINNSLSISFVDASVFDVLFIVGGGCSRSSILGTVFPCSQFEFKPGYCPNNLQVD